jgi:hypothetical protein
LNPQALTALLQDFDQAAVEVFSKYCWNLENEKKDNQPKNPWMQHRSDQQLADIFKAVSLSEMTFDGVHITLLATGVSYDYVAYRNKMLMAYPESKIDMDIVYDGDQFSPKKESGKVLYTHVMENSFSSKKEDKVIGAYCVIKNKRGEFITTLSSDELKKHREVAKTDYIWKKWFIEMCLKTVIKKACKKHFDDIYEGIEKLDNENYDLDQPTGFPIEMKGEIEALKTVQDTVDYYQKHLKVAKRDKFAQVFVDALAIRKDKIVKELQNADS